MPKVHPDTALYNAVEALVDAAGGNESEAARRVGTTRLRINRIRKSRGAVTPAVRSELWKKLELFAQGNPPAQKSDTFDTETIQIVRDVPGVALQVLRYMTGIIQRDIGREGHANER
ncbi:hypothetical protein OK349_15475 [Sphingomonas sp. BT-65]|uniref:hypothetical protein n=1 Tax=Sphingomonas sp. BT-65 TaxID=2989821 RepID=UPI002235FDFA|nr:hypothetical protein [Sphingomonas sp. BT-65]MCW4463114.1 hypothetical protein [Sphingomonas sp. BT-65]